MFIVKVPGINGNGKTNGCEKAGNEIIESLNGIPNNEQNRVIDVKLMNLDEIHLDNKNLEITNKLIYENALEIFQEKPKTIFLGGDHSISYSLCRAFLEHCKESGKEPCLIVFDSRPNCMNVNSKFPSNEEWLRGLINSGFPTESILLVGARTLQNQEIEFLNKNRIRNISINQLLINIDDICDTIMEFSNKKELYISIDISIVDPAFAPAATFQEPGGLSSRQIIYLIQRMNRIKNLRSADIVEINPEKQGKEITCTLGAKIVSELV